MTCSQCFCGTGVYSPLPLSIKKAGPGRLSKIFFTQWHPRSMMKKQISFPFTQNTGMHCVSTFSPYVRLFSAVWRCQCERTFFPCRDCMSVYRWLSGGTDCVLFQALWHASCHGRPQLRFSPGLCVAYSWQVQSVRSLAATSNHSLISLGEKWDPRPRWIFTKISLEIHLNQHKGESC